MRSKNLIPLPEVCEHTDKLDIQSLSLPVGFDQERMGVNVRAFEGVIRRASFSTLTIRAVDGERRQIEASVGGINPDGTANMLGRVATAKIDLHQSHSRLVVPGVDPLYQGSLEESYGKLEAIVEINANEKEARIEDRPRRWPKGVMDPKAQAHFIDAAVRDGLKKEIKEAHFRSMQKIGTGIEVVTYGFGISFHGALAENGVGVPGDEFVAGAVMGGLGCIALFKGFDLLDCLDALKSRGMKPSDRNWSLFYGVPFDRNLLAKAHANRTLVKAIA